MREIFFKTECLTRYTLSRFLKRIHEKELPPIFLKPVISIFEKLYNVKSFEFEDQDFKSFSHYFTRNLKDIKNIRPIGSGLISPVDASGIKAQNFKISKNIKVKFTHTTLRKFTGFELDDSDFFAIHFYLSPKDYHRVHCPLESVTIEDARYIEGHRLMIEKLDASFLTQNERVCLKLKYKKTITLYFVLTGAFCVGNIYFSSKQSILNTTNIKDIIGLKFNKLDEIAKFAFGSSCSLILPKEHFSPSGSINSKKSILLGQTIGEIL
ncbi:MAG: phosphatidylserine decarboxylase [Bacteriovoracaceae bacterium]